MNRLRQYELVYVGSPYSRYPGDIHQAFVDVSRLMGQLVAEGLKVYSPIAHTHPIAIYGGLDPLDHKIWLPFNMAIIRKSDAMLVAKMSGWDRSKGVREEIGIFKEQGKPVHYLDVNSLKVSDEPYK